MYSARGDQLTFATLAGAALTLECLLDLVADVRDERGEVPRQIAPHKLVVVRVLEDVRPDEVPLLNELPNGT
jgi:hypothetical protein